MPTTEVDVIVDGDSQVIRLPHGYEVRAERVSVRRLGEAVLIEPVPLTAEEFRALGSRESALIEPVLPRDWPPGFFDAIRSDDPTFVRPDQGQLPPAPSFDDESSR